MIIVLCITLYTTRVVLKMLGVVDYGVYNVVCGFVSMFAFLRTSMSNGIQRFYNYELGRNGEEGANKVYCTSFVIQLILALIIVIFTESLGIWYLHNKMVIPEGRMVAAEWIFQFSILSFLFIVIQAPYTAAVMAHERMDFYAIINVFDAFLKLGIVFILPYLNADQLIIYGFLMACISVINFLLYYIYCRRNFKEIRLHRFFNKQQFYAMLSFSGWNLFGSFSGIMKSQGINLILNFFFGPVVNAARGVATQVNGGLESFISNITTPVRPQVIKSYAQGNITRTINLSYSISKLSCYFYYMIALPVILEINYILHLWLGKNVPEHTASFIIIVIMIALIGYLNSAVSGIVHASGRMMVYQLSTGIIGITSVPVAYYVLKMGAEPEWALIVLLISKAIAQYASLIILKRIIKISLISYTKEVLFPLVVVIISTFIFPTIVHFSLDEGFMRLFAVVMVDIIVICLSSYFWGLNDSEKALFKEMITNIHNKFKIKLK